MDHDETAAALRQQALLYGSPLADRVRDIRDRLDLTQGRVAAILGLSAPMLSQLVNGQRTKIANPIVLDRLDQLSDLAASLPDGPAAPDVEARLAAIHDSADTAHTRRAHHSTGGHDDDVAAGRVLRATCSHQALVDAAALLETTHPDLADLLRSHAREPSADG